MHSSEPECQNPYVNNLEVNNGRYYCCPESITIKDSRSRYAEFIYRHCVKSSCHTVRRDREPSRIPVKRLTRVLQKSRKIRRLVKKHITKNVPRSSGIHITCRSFRRTVVYSHNTQQCRSAQKVKPRKRRVFTSHLATTARRKNRKTYNLKFELKGNCRFPKAVSKYVSTESHVYKNLNHRVKFCQSSLCVDIEKIQALFLLFPLKHFVHHIVKVMLQCLVKMLDSNVQPCLYVTIGGIVSKETVCCVGGKVKH